eukprot:3299122-Alexandrium_andersonii.AAC.2
MDQSSAFERIALLWLQAVLEGLGIPCWLRRTLMATVAGRCVQAVSGSWAGPVRTLLRSVGMGGAPSFFV